MSGPDVGLETLLELGSSVLEQEGGFWIKIDTRHVPASERQPGNLSRTLKTMSRYGLVDLQRDKTHVRPVVKATGFRIMAAA